MIVPDVRRVLPAKIFYRLIIGRTSPATLAPIPPQVVIRLSIQQNIPIDSWCELDKNRMPAMYGGRRDDLTHL